MSELDGATDLTDDQSFWDQLDDNPSTDSPDWSGDDLEEAYQKAMAALEASDAELPEPPPLQINPIDQVPVSGIDSSAGPGSANRIEAGELTAELGELSKQVASKSATTNDPSAAVNPRQILEALLFVGGEPLTTKRLSHVLRGEFSAEFIESQIDELNELYLNEQRPYEIRFGDGGYRLTLRDDFEKIRRKTYGLGPKEVRLSQDVLEVLAIVAYHQPIATAGIHELGKPGCDAVLRQLLRRELICMERIPERPREVLYRTTPRFLSLFGLRNLNELPRLEQVSYK